MSMSFTALKCVRFIHSYVSESVPTLPLKPAMPLVEVFLASRALKENYHKLNWCTTFCNSGVFEKPS